MKKGVFKTHVIFLQQLIRPFRQQIYLGVAMTIDELKALSNEQLISETAKMITVQNQCVARQIVLIVEIDSRRLHWRAGYSNLAHFLVATFSLSEDQSYKRIRVARAAQYFPQLLEPLRRGETTLTNLALAAPRLTQANCETVLENIKGRSKRETQDFLAKVTADGRLVEETDPSVELKIRVPVQLMDKLQRAREVMASRGQHPKTVEVIEAALEALLDRNDPLRKAERTARRREKNSGKASCVDPKAATASVGVAAANNRRRRPLPAALRHEVWLRDSGQCTYEADDGHRCTERAMLEVDHIVPVCRGGDNSLSNLRLRCRAHNQYAAEISLGSAFMAMKRGDHRPVYEIKREPVEKALLVPEPVDLAGVEWK
jgi:5-methylcytosine-specific restriction endonuclease McrA